MPYADVLDKILAPDEIGYYTPQEVQEMLFPLKEGQSVFKVLFKARKRAEKKRLDSMDEFERNLELAHLEREVANAVVQYRYGGLLKKDYIFKKIN